MSQELSSNISNFFMLHVIVNGFTVAIWIKFSELHEIDTDAVISKGFSVNITNSFADLQEFLVLFDSLFELAEVIVEYTSRIVSTAFITRFTGSLASES